MENIYTDDYFATSVGSTKKNFANFVKINTEKKISEGIDDSEIDFLAHRIAQNMFYYKQNIQTAKTDYITLIGMLMKKGLILKEFKDLTPDRTYFHE